MKAKIAALLTALALAGCGITQTVEHPPWAQDAWERGQAAGSAD